RLEALDASFNHLYYLPTATKELRNLKRLTILHNPTVHLPQELGLLHQLTCLEADDHPLRVHIRGLYLQQWNLKVIRQYLLPPIGKEPSGSWLLAPNEGLFCNIKYPKDTQSRGRVKVKKMAFCMKNYQFVARIVQKIRATPAKEIHSTLRI